MRRLRRLGIVAAVIAALVAGGTLTGAFVRPVQAIDIGSILKIGGIVLVVSTFGDQIDSFINKLLGEHEAATVGATKVVPIFSIGQGAYIGAAQIVGVPANVQQVQGVAALDVTLGNISGTGLVPISTRTPGRTLDRVSGVGISAIIDFHI